MLILIDLDGTILNSVHPTWKTYKDGQGDCCIEDYLDRLPFFPGAKEFIQKQKEMGNTVMVVSDSHPRFVDPICKYIDCDSVSLAGKPNREFYSLLLYFGGDVEVLEPQFVREECFLMIKKAYEIYSLCADVLHK